MAYKVGITGGIGSGKTTVCKVFEVLGIPVFNADIEAKKLVNSNENIRTALKKLFGNDIYISDNKIDRMKFAGIIFNDDLLLQQVNKIIHPEVAKQFADWESRQKSQYVIHEAAILFESGFHTMMDLNILVTAPVDIRQNRVVERDKTNAEDFLKRVAKQWSDDEKRKLADIEIINDGKKLIISQIIDIESFIKDKIDKLIKK